MKTIEEITEQVKAVLEYSQGAQDLKGVPTLMKNWQEHKQKYIDIFGDYIYDCGPVSFQQSESALNDSIDEFMRKVARTNGGTLQNLDFFAFLGVQGPEGFFKNTTTNPYSKPDGTRIPVGMKMGRAFKYFFKDEKALNDVQTQYSIQISAPKLTGHLYFSVHPLDYLSVSENNANWTSCHSLHGDYRAGNLGYMQDDCTIVCYIADPEMEKVKNFPKEIPWNSKKWRMLLYRNEDIMFNGRQYPFEIDGILDEVGKRVLDLFDERIYDWSKWHDDNFAPFTFKNETDLDQLPPRFKQYICVRERVGPITDYVSDADGSQHYNDVLRSGHYKPAYRFRRKYLNNDEGVYDELKIKVGAKCTCINCNRDEPVAESSTMMCQECDLKYNPDAVTCDCCGGRVNEDASYTLYDGQVVCENCYETECEQCECCGEDFFRDEMFRDEDGYWYCENCYHSSSDDWY